jgi:hypothetical protein
MLPELANLVALSKKRSDRCGCKTDSSYMATKNRVESKSSH